MAATLDREHALEHLGVGIDTARFGHRVSFLKPDRQPAAKPITVMENHAGYETLKTQLEALHRKHPKAQIQVRIDAAGQYAANLERFLRQLPLPLVISIGEPKRNKDYQNAHFPKRTTDDTESQAMARYAVVELPPATPPSNPQMDLLREIAGRLQAQVKDSTQCINRLHNLLARVFPELATITNNLAAGWVLRLLHKYPTAQRIAQAQLSSLEAIPYAPPRKVEKVHQAAKLSVASVTGAIAEKLVHTLVSEVRESQKVERNLRDLLVTAYAALPPSGHVQLSTIPGFGDVTAAILTAKIVDVGRFRSPDSLVNYFGVFPEESSSGVDKRGRPIPPGTMVMCRKGNDLVRAYLWNATKSAIRHNPAIRALYRRQRGRGKRGDVAFGHCMRKLLHLAYAVWTTNRPFDKDHYPWDNPKPAGATAGSSPTAPIPSDLPTSVTVPTASAVPEPAAAVETVPASTPATSPAEAQVLPAAPDGLGDVSTTVTSPATGVPELAASTDCVTTSGTGERALPVGHADEKAVGHKRDVPAKEVVTTASASSSLSTPPPVVNRPAAAAAASSVSPPDRPSIDFKFLREQIGLAQVLMYLGLLEGLRGPAQQRRGRCPIHGRPGDRARTFSVNLEKNAFQCFDADCSAQGNVLDLWMAVKKLPPYEAALDLAATFNLLRTREEEPVKEPVPGRQRARKKKPS